MHNYVESTISQCEAEQIKENELNKWTSCCGLIKKIYIYSPAPL